MSVDFLVLSPFYTPASFLQEKIAHNSTFPCTVVHMSKPEEHRHGRIVTHSSSAQLSMFSFKTIPNKKYLY